MTVKCKICGEGFEGGAKSYFSITSSDEWDKLGQHYWKEHRAIYKEIKLNTFRHYQEEIERLHEHI